ncbi:hypothetical protein [endosymbiont of Acanthamoeba sp. UWC8]|uniref:hypothetical protein n=1 Tax=endosymbiont of Acanthamoeba sp. UWC8 TaxID=86106 RepID=UPI00056E627F|nr:hypothetical protein [endosymbiont of Acanthamoeba sp. UWC8]
MHNNLSQAKNIIDYWSWVERFTPPTLFDNDSAIKTVLGDQEIPWLNPDYSEDETHTWLYSVYVGVINCKNIIEKLKAELGSELIDSNSKNEESESYLFCFEVDINGHPIGDSIAIPDYVASMGCLIKVRHLTPDIWLDNFDPIKTKIEEMLKNIFCNLRQPDTQAPLNFTLFEQMVGAVKQITEWKELLYDVKNQVRIDIRKIAKPKNIQDNSIEEIETESENESLKLFNSFFFKDLKSISDDMKRNEPLGEVLLEYLNIVPCPPKADIRKDKTLLQTLLSPNNLAVARWPGKGDHPLVLGQQLAVNTLFNSKTEMFSVNGSPGTGKTTLLRDVIANIVVLRAQKLAALNSPDDAYTGSENVCIANYNYKIWKLNEELLGHGIVISSPNNAAIKNITTEIPLAGAIDDKWGADYFSEVASHIFGKKCWGLTAAPLGSSKNVKEFFNAFWPIHPKDKTFNKLLLDNNADFEDWQQAKENFLACIKSFNSIQNELNNIEKFLKEKAQILDCLNTIKLKHNDLTKEIKSVDESKQKIFLKKLELEDKISEHEKAKAYLKEIKPSFIKRILNFFFDRKKNLEWDTKYNQRIQLLIKLSDKK